MLVLIVPATAVKASPRQQTVVDICSRTPEVQTAILRATGLSTCSTVTPTQLASITDLTVTGYSASSFAPSDLAGLTGLRSLSINNSPMLTTVPDNAFSQVTGVTSLSLDRIGITSLAEDAFDGLTALESLGLHRNSLTTLDADIFDGLTALETLNLYSNSLTTLDADIFDGLTALETLNLYSNSLTTLDADIFDGLTALRALRLERNRLTTLDADIFDGLTALRALRLERNRLTTLDADIFDGLTRLESLSFRCNFFTELDLDIFDPFAATLTTLDIKGAAFTTPLSEMAIRAKLPNLMTLQIGGEGCPIVPPGVTVSPTSLTIPQGSSDTYTVTLRTQPTGNVMVAISSNNTEVTVVPTTLTFTDTNWNTAQMVTVSAAQDTDTLDDSATLTHDPSGADYDSVSNTTLTVTVEDDDDPAVTVSFGQASYSVAEGDDITVTVTLSADPEREVIIPLTTTNQDSASNSDYSGVPANVTFNAGGPTEMTFTFTATDDTVDDDGERVQLEFGTMPDARVTPGTTDVATVSILDNDDPEVTVSFGQASYSVTEGGTVDVTVTLSADPERSLSITLTTTNQDGASNSDYSGVPANVTFNSGETSKTFSFAISDDTVDDDGERVLLEFGAMPDARVNPGTTDVATVSILDNDDPEVTVSFGQASYSVAEGGTVDVTVTLSADPERSLSIPLTATNQDGASNADYSGVPANVTFNAGGPTEMTFTITATDDSVDDDGERVLLEFGAMPDARVNPGTTDVATVSILDNDDPEVTVSFGQAMYSVTEGGTVDVTVTLSADPEREVIIPLTTTNQDGASNSDYSGVPTNVTFNATETEKTFTFTATQDTADDDGERVLLGFTALPPLVTEGTRGTATVAIDDDDDPEVTVSFGQATYSVAEGDDVTVTVTLSADPERSLSITLTTTNQDGASNADYSGVPANVTFNAGGPTEMTFTITATDDSVDDDGERVLLEFGAMPDARVNPGTTDVATVSILDDDDPEVTVSFGQAMYSVTEGGTVDVTVTLSADPERSLSITLTTTNQDGASNSDYSGVPANVTFNSGNTSKTFTFTATQDTVDDDGESVLLGFTALPTLVTEGGTATSTVSITDNDDPAVTVSFGSATYTAPEGGSATVTVTLSADPERSVTITLTATNQDGASDADYSGVPANVTFSAGGATSKTFTFAATQDTVDDDGERVLLGFTALPARVTEGGTATSTVSITDDDDPAVTVSFGSATFTAAEGGSATVTVTLSADPERSVTITLTKSNQDGASDADYSVPTNVTFSAGGATSKTFTFTATQDTVDDDGERVLLGFIALPARVTEGGTATSTVSITDDDDPAVMVSFGQAAYSVAEGDDVTVMVTLSADPERSVTITLTKSNQGTTTNTDYSGVPANVTFNATETEKTFIFAAVDDTEDDDGESVVLGFVALPARVAEGTRGTATVAIGDDDDPPVTMSFGQAAYSVAEGDDVTVTVTLSADPERSVTIPITRSNRDGASNSDYSGVPANVTFNSGNTSKTFTFTATQDTADDDGESVLLGFTALPTLVTEGGTATSTVSITDNDDPAVTVSFGSATYTAPEGGSATVTVTATNQDGASDADYSVPTNVTFSAGGATSKTFTFTATQDTVDDDGERVLLGFIALPARVTEGGTATSTVSITDDDDPAVTVSISQAAYSAAEGGSVSVAVTLSADPERTVTVPITAANRGGASSDDYSGVPARVTFNSGDSSESFTFMATEDLIDDDGESVLLGFGRLPARVSEGTPDETTVSITDDDGSGVTILPVSLEIDEGMTEPYTIVLDSQPTADVTVTPSVSSGSGFSFTPASLTFTTSNWNTARAVTVTGTSDADALDHSGVISHSVASTDSNYHGSSASNVSVRVTDDEDIPVTVRFEEESYGVTEGGSVTVKVLLSADPDRSVTIPLTRSNQGTTIDDDYSGVPNSMTFNAGDTEATFTFAATQDTADDDGESLLLGFGSLPNAVAAGTAAETTLNIGDDDDPEITVSFEHATYTANEGSRVTVAVVLSADPEREVIIPLTTTNQGGAADDDYSDVAASVTFTAGDIEKTVTFRAIQDTVDDGGESVELGFGALPARVAAGGTATATAVVDLADDDTRGVRVEPTQLTFREGGSGTYTVVLNTQPTATVTVTVNDPTDNTDVTAEPTSLTFTTGDWNSAQTVTVTAARDGDANTDTATVTHSVNGGDYNAVNAADVTVTVTESARPPPPPIGGGGGFGSALEAPRFVDGFRTSRPLAVTARAGDAVGDPVAATHPRDLVITYALSGADAALFTVDEETGQIRLLQAIPLELGQTYTVNLTATDSSGTGAIIIEVIEVVEAAFHKAAFHRYDLNKNGSIELNEALTAVGDYFRDIIDFDLAVEVVNLYYGR